jgi:anti-sigma B factor antagonist
MAGQRSASQGRAFSVFARIDRRAKSERRILRSSARRFARRAAVGAALGIQQRQRGAVTVLELTGWLVAFDSDEAFKEYVMALVRADQLDILLDMSRITYIDSAGVGVLVGTLLHVMRRGGRLKLLAPSARVKRVLGITGLHAVFETFDREEDAVASFTGPAPQRRLPEGVHDGGQ